MNEANREQADKCLEVAKTALRAGEVAKAERFALKAAKLFPNDEARLLMAQIKRAAGTAPSSSGGAAGANGHHQAGPSGMGTGPTLRRQRQQPARGAASRRDEPTDEDHLATPEQRELVKRIRATSEYYQVLQIERTATEDDVKKAYRRLALKLHPDKNKARGADEAFKAVSKAFTCLSDPVKRRHYDAHGREEGAGALGGGGGRHGGGGGGFYGGGVGDIDPEEIFNMFFGGNNPFMGGRMYTTGFGGGQQHRQAQAQAQARRQQAARGQASDANPLLQLAQLLPLVILLIFTFFSGRSQPAYSLKATREYRHPATTTTHQVVFYVQDLQQLQRNYPPGGRERVRLEHQIESEYRGALQQQCYNERMLQQRYHYYGRRDEAKRMELKSCDELTRRFGSRGAGAR